MEIICTLGNRGIQLNIPRRLGITGEAAAKARSFWLKLPEIALVEFPLIAS